MLTTPDRAPDLLARLGENLTAAGHLDAAGLARAERVSAETGERLDHVLCRLGLVEEGDMADALAALAGLDRIAPQAFPDLPLCAEDLSLRFLKSARILPVAERGEVLRIAVADPLDIAAAEAVAMRLNRPVERGLATPAEIDAALARLYETEDLAADTDPADSDTAADVARLRDLASEAPVIRLVNQLIAKAVEARASDIHIEPMEGRLRIRLRVDGALTEIDPPPGTLRAAIISRIKIMARLNIAEQRLPQDGRMQLTVAGRQIDMRVATVPTLAGEGVVLRLLDRAGLVLEFDALGFDALAKAQFLPLIERPNGILLVTGPTGSGKTTTLYAALEHINTTDRKIITIEDPVEYQLPGVTQIQVKPQIGLSFASGLRSILRQDPDVIMIGEIRDAETAEIAVQAALTGHLVLATLHTNSAVAAINRLRDMGVEDYLITATLIGVQAQRLLRRLCPHCHRPMEAAMAEGLAPGIRADFRAPGGCEACRGRGFKGRTGVLEVLTVTEEIRRAILARADVTELEALAVQAGMRPMRAHGIEKAAAGETALTELARVVAER
ncbi:MAG: ATPase, T2SS/T4P/T4SS family [Pseudomonadota bacterium]